jgi:zinc transport system substrate-binding protein
LKQNHRHFNPSKISPRAGLRVVLSFILLVGLLAGLLLATAGCAQSSSNQASSGSASTTAVSFTYVTSVYPLYVAALNLTADIEGVEVVNMAGTVVGCLHDYQLTPGNLKTIEAANAFIFNGSSLEVYLDQVTSNQPDLQMINASTGIDTLNGNPHLWVSIAAMIRQVDNIAQGMAKADPTHQDDYLANAKVYIDKLTRLQADLHAQIDPLPNRNIVTFHEAFPYFAQEFKLNIVAVVEREPDSRPSAAELAATIDQIRQLDVQAVFVEPQYAADTAATIAKETGVAVYTLDPASSGPLNDPDAYLNIMRQNGQTLAKALK